jgi:carbon monoxide dehydrogenase subunit G
MLKRLLQLLIGLVVVAVIGSFFIPANQQVSRSLVISQPPERIWALIIDPPAWNQWSPWYRRDPSMKITYDGAPKGEGARWSWVSDSEGSGNMQIVRADVPRQMQYVMAFDGMGAASGQFVLEPADGGTQVTWSFESDAGYNPIARWFGLALDKFIGPDFEAGLNNMATALKAKS